MRKRGKLKNILILFLIMFCCFENSVDAQRRGGKRTRSVTGVKKGTSKTRKKEPKTIEIKPVIKYDSQKVDSVFGFLLYYSKNDNIYNLSSFDKFIGHYNECSTIEQDSIRSRMITLITDSLKAEHKEISIAMIDVYKKIAKPDDDYLSSLVMSQAEFYYNEMNPSKMDSLLQYLTDISKLSALDYSEELSELKTKLQDIEYGCDGLIGYWIVDDEMDDPQIFMKIEKEADSLIVSMSIPEFNFDTYQKRQSPEVQEMGKIIKEKMDSLESLYEGNQNKMLKAIAKNPSVLSLANNNQENFKYKEYFNIKGNLTSLLSCRTGPKSINFFWSSSKSKKGNEALAIGLRSGIRVVSNSFIGEFAKSNTYSWVTSLFGTWGSIIAEIFLNTMVDGIAVSKNTIKTIGGELELTGRNEITGNFCVDYYHATTETEFERDSTDCQIKFMRYNLEDPEIVSNTAFIVDNKLRQHKIFKRKERKEFIQRHPEAEIKGRKSSIDYINKKNEYNQTQMNKLREYNKTH